MPLFYNRLHFLEKGFIIGVEMGIILTSARLSFSDLLHTGPFSILWRMRIPAAY